MRMVDGKLTTLDDEFIYQGESKDFLIHIKKQDASSVDISSMTVRFSITDIIDESIVHISKTGINNVQEGYSLISFDSKDTETLPISKYRYKIEVTFNTGRNNISKGYFTVM